MVLLFVRAIASIQTTAAPWNTITRQQDLSSLLLNTPNTNVSNTTFSHLRFLQCPTIKQPLEPSLHTTTLLTHNHRTPSSTPSPPANCPVATLSSWRDRLPTLPFEAWVSTESNPITTCGNKLLLLLLQHTKVVVCTNRTQKCTSTSNINNSNNFTNTSKSANIILFDHRVTIPFLRSGP